MVKPKIQLYKLNFGLPQLLRTMSCGLIRRGVVGLPFCLRFVNWASRKLALFEKHKINFSGCGNSYGLRWHLAVGQPRPFRTRKDPRGNEIRWFQVFYYREGLSRSDSGLPMALPGCGSSAIVAARTLPSTLQSYKVPVPLLQPPWFPQFSITSCCRALAHNVFRPAK